MGNGIYANTDEIYRQGDKTINYAAEFATQINNLKSNKDGLLGIWRGEAATEFGNSVDEQVKNLNEFQSILEEMGNKIVEGSNRLHQTEEENTDDSKKLMEQDYNFRN